MSVSIIVKRDLKNTGLIFGFILSLAMWGCTATSLLSIHYEPDGPPSFTIPPEMELTIFLGPIKGNDSRLWYRMGEYEWFLERPPALTVYDAVAEELGRMGITVTKNLSEGQGNLAIEVRWFGPYGYNPSSAAVILSLSLYRKGALKPLWRDKFEGGAFPQTPAWTIWEKSSHAEETASDALGKAVKQLGWRAGFQTAVSSLLRNAGSMGTDG
jgi:hypothetical protein